VAGRFRYWWEMRSLTAARLMLLDSDQVRREALAKALSEIGAFEIIYIPTVAEAANIAIAMPDLIVIEGPSLAANDEAGSISANPFATSGIPTILLLPDATNEMRRTAIRAGYSIVLGAPVSPRLLYRRIAHLLQNARRMKRRAEAALERSRKETLEEVPPLQVALLAEAPAH
jgi:DNA-binding NarL/FixJ family response regulator